MPNVLFMHESVSNVRPTRTRLYPEPLWYHTRFVAPDELDGAPRDNITEVNNVDDWGGAVTAPTFVRDCAPSSLMRSVSMLYGL